LLVHVVVAARGTVTALAGNAGVRVPAEDRAVTFHARAFHVVGIGEADGLHEARRLRRVELLQRVEVRLALEGSRLLLLPLRGLAVVVVAAHALAGAGEGLGRARAGDGEPKREARPQADARSGTHAGHRAAIRPDSWRGVKHPLGRRNGGEATSF